MNTGDQYTGRGEDFWDNYPSNLNPTIPPDTIKEYTLKTAYPFIRHIPAALAKAKPR